MVEPHGCFCMIIGLAAIIAVCYFGCKNCNTPERTMSDRIERKTNSGSFSYHVHSRQETFESKHNKKVYTTNTVVIDD